LLASSFCWVAVILSFFLLILNLI